MHTHFKSANGKYYTNINIYPKNDCFNVYYTHIQKCKEIKLKKNRFLFEERNIKCLGNLYAYMYVYKWNPKNLRKKNPELKNLGRKPQTGALKRTILSWNVDIHLKNWS